MPLLLFPGPAGTPSRRRGAHLLRPARHRHRPGHVTSAMTARPLLGRLRKAMRSADVARSRPDEVAVSPAIGPLPAIIVPVNRPIPAHPVDNPRPGAGGRGELPPGFAAGAFETADGLFVATDLGGDGFEATAQLVDLDGQAGQGGGVAATGGVLVDDGMQAGLPVEGDPADPGAGGYLGDVTAARRRPARRRRPRPGPAHRGQLARA
jgi:hypothetical protein